MKQVSIQTLKKHLSSLLEEAAAGERIVITRYRRPLAELGAVTSPGLQVGPSFGRGLGPSQLDRATGGRYLEVLEEDRNRDGG